MKKIIALLIIFLTSINLFSIDTYKIEKGRFKSNNTDIRVVQPFVWQPWQEMNAKVTLDYNKKEIVTYFENIIKYTYTDHSTISNIITYYTKDGYILSFYDDGREEYLNIYDSFNKFEMYYKINKIK